MFSLDSSKETWADKLFYCATTNDCFEEICNYVQKITIKLLWPFCNDSGNGIVMKKKENCVVCV